MRNKKYDSLWYPTAEYRFFLFDPGGNGMAYFKTAEERDAYADDEIHLWCDDGWSEEVKNVIAGEVTHHTVRTNVIARPVREDYDSDEDFEYAVEEFSCHTGADYTCNYELKPIDVQHEPEPEIKK